MQIMVQKKSKIFGNNFDSIIHVDEFYFVIPLGFILINNVDLDLSNLMVIRTTISPTRFRTLPGNKSPR